MSVDPKELERIKMAEKMKGFSEGAAAMLEVAKVPLPSQDLEVAAKNEVTKLINEWEPRIINTIQPQQVPLVLKALSSNMSNELLKKDIHVTPNQILGQIYLETLRRSQSSNKVSNAAAPTQTSTPKPIILPSPDQERRFLLVSLKSLSPLQDYGNGIINNENLANRTYNQLLKDYEPPIKSLIIRLTNGDNSKELLTEAKKLLNELNAVNEFTLTGSKSYPKAIGLDSESIQQKAVIINDSDEAEEYSKTHLQTSTLKLPPVEASSFFRLDRDNEGNFIFINQQGMQEQEKKPQQGTYSFVILGDAPNEVRIGLGHSAISHGQNVLFAGEIKFIKEDGKMVMENWTNDSGHYATDPSTMHRTLYAVDSAKKLLFDSDKFKIREERHFVPLPSHTPPGPQVAMPVTNEPNPSASVQSPATASSSSTPSTNWAARMSNLNNDFKESRNTYNHSGLFTASFNVHRETQPSLREIATPTTQQEQSAANTSQEKQRPTTPRLGHP